MTPPDNPQEFWDRRAVAWERRADTLDAFSDAYGIPVMDDLGLEGGERVVDIGCGPGTTAVVLATRVGATGEVVGVDISREMIAAANRRATVAGVANVRFVVADAQRDPMGKDFDAAYSRFGVMFFDDPVAAFANIGRSLRSGGCLGCVVWGPLFDNPWMFVPTAAAAPVLRTELALPEAGDPGPFSLDTAERVDEILTAAGYVDISVERLEAARLITAEAAGDNITTLLAVGPVGEAYEAADERTREAAMEAVITAIESYREGDTWRLPGTALQVLARRP